MSEAPQQGQGQPTPDDGGQPSDAAPRTFTQADLNKIAANEKRDGTKAGKQAAISELLEKTGAESIDDVLSAYTEYRGIQEAVTTEADRANKRAENLEKRAKTAEERYTTTLREYALRDALRDSGINSARLPLALRVADLESLSVDDEGAVSGIEGVVEAIKEASPEWFASDASQAPQRQNAPQTQGTGVQRPGSNGADVDQQHASFLASLINP